MDQEAGQKNATALDGYPGAGDKVGGEERQSHQEVLTLPPFGDSAIASENDQVRHLQKERLLLYLHRRTNSYLNPNLLGS